MDDRTVFVEGVSSDSDSLYRSIEEVLLKSTNNLEWLSRDDLVLLKPALNSPDPYPSTTHPIAVQVVREILSEKGAEVIVGDQSGLKDVLQDQHGVVHGKTQDNYIKSGIGTSEDRFIGFESEGWDEGYIHHQSKYTRSWPKGFNVTRWIEEADHIINLPRLSTHSQAGVTLGFKNMVGILRDDSRMDFHANGPFNNFIKTEAHGSKLHSIDDGSHSFIEKIVEIHDAIREKLRTTLFVATKAQTTFGPNTNALKIGKLEIGTAHVVKLKPGLIFASNDPVSAESFALAVLKDLRKSLPSLPKFSSQLLLFSNPNVKQLDETPIKNMTFIHHAIEMGLGEMPNQIIYKNVPDNLKERLNNYIKL